MAGAVFGDVELSLCVAGAVFGDVELSLFVAGAVFAEIWNDSRSAKCCIFQYKMLVVGVKSNLGCEAGCGGRFPARNVSEILENHFAWQAQYLVSLDNDACCSAHCK